MTSVRRLVGPESFERLSRLLDRASEQPTRGYVHFEDLLRVQQEVIAHVLEGAGLDEVLNYLADGFNSAFAPARCGLFLFDSHTGRLRGHAAPGLDRALGLDGALHPDRKPGGEPAEGPIEAALAQGARTVVADFQMDSRWPIFAAKALVRGLRACWAEPAVDCAKGLTAVLALFHPRPGEPDGTDERGLKAAASLVAFAIKATEREQAIRLEKERFASLTAAVPGVVYQRLVTPDGQIRYTYISEGARELFGVEPDEILSNPNALFSRHGADYSANFRERLLAASKALTMWDVEATIVTPDGRKKYTHAIARPQRQTDGSVLWTGLILDETRIREGLLESLSEGILLYDADDRLVIRNSHFLGIYPDLKDVAVPGATYDDVMRGECASMSGLQDQPDGLSDLQRRLAQHAEAHSASEHHLKDGRWILVNEHRTSDGGTVVHYTDITEMKRREQQIQHLAMHDALTGLPNRLLFHQRLEEALVEAQTGTEAVAVMCLDLDHFKTVNESLGQTAGDAYLKVVATRLGSCVRDHDTVARLGSDEFGIVLTKLADVEAATSLAARVLSCVKEPAHLDGHQVVAGASIGVAASAGDGVDGDRLLKDAYLALHRAKADGRGVFRFSRAHVRRALEIELRQAIARGEMEVHYQPQVNLATDTVIGFEALVRWNHPERGRVPPSDFIPLAEETGLITEIGQWVLRRACADAAHWPDHIKIAVNVSAAQFRDHDLAERVAEILKDVGLPPRRLEIEVTESLLLRDGKANLRILDELRSLGVRISMDDFGTGYSSLSNLRSFPFDKIKIDRSFVKELDENPDSAAIVRAVLGLGQSLGISTCAEGVETAEQMAALRDQGCTEVQGYYLGAPKALDELAPFLGAASSA